MTKRTREDTGRRCPRCNGATKAVVRCSVCHDAGCAENCVPRGDGTVCVRCTSLGADESGPDDPEPDRDEDAGEEE